MERFQEILAMSLKDFMAACDKQQMNLFQIALIGLLQDAKVDKSDVSKRICQWFTRCVSELDGIGEQKDVQASVYFLSAAFVLLGAVAEMQQEFPWWSDASQAIASMVKFLFSIHRDDTKPFVHSCVVMLERGVAAICTRSEQVRSCLQSDAEFMRSAFGLRWRGNCFILKSVALPLLDPPFVVRWIEPQERRAFDIRLLRVSGNDQMCIRTMRATGRGRGDAPLRMFSWFSWTRGSISHAFMSSIWPHAGVYYAGVPHDIAPCRRLKDTPRVVIALPLGRIGVRVTDDSDFPWMDDGAVEVLKTYGKEETEEMLAEMAEATGEERRAVAQEEAERTNCVVDSSLIGAYCWLINKAVEEDWEDGDDEEEEEEVEQLNKVTPESMWKYRHVWFSDLNEGQVKHEPCPWCSVSGVHNKEGIEISNAVINIVTHLRKEIYNAVIGGTLDNQELSTMAGSRGGRSTISCTVCGKTSWF